VSTEDRERLRTVRHRLPAVPETVPHARRAAAAAMDAGVPVQEPVRSDVLLVVSELVSNAVRHGEGPIDLAVEVSTSHVHVEVTDQGDARPQPARPAAMSQSGRGLLIVDSIADAWGVSVEPHGKTVWADLLIQPALAQPVPDEQALDKPALKRRAAR
jgi:anti-sigma regulatory factor (Ser/Thr protein kinase)